MKGIIYKATNLYNGLSYIGQTRATLEKRKIQHLKDAVTDSVNHFHLALMQYSDSGFKWEILDEFSGSKEEVIHALNVAEEYHILRLKTRLSEYGYNATQGGYSSDKFEKAVNRKHNRKSILQYDLDGNFIQEFESVSDVGRHFGCVGLNTNTFVNRIWRGFQWRVRDGLGIDRKIGTCHKQRYHLGAVVYDPSGKLYKRYDTIQECLLDLGKSYKIRNYLGEVSIRSVDAGDFIVFRNRGEDFPGEIKINIIYPSKVLRIKKESLDIPIVLYSRDGEYVREYPSISAAHKDLGVSEKSIRDWCAKSPPFVLRDSRTMHIWQKKGSNVPTNVEVKPYPKQSKTRKMEHRVIQYSQQGELLKIWENKSIASAVTGESEYIIKKQCEGQPIKKKTASIWKYYTPSYSQSIEVA